MSTENILKVQTMIRNANNKHKEADRDTKIAQSTCIHPDVTTHWNKDEIPIDTCVVCKLQTDAVDACH